MIFVQHRCNNSRLLKQVSPDSGVEIDLRLHDGEIVLAHDPRVRGELFSDWLKTYQHALLILNVKEDGLEGEIYELIMKHGIREYFFLDQPFPTLRKSIQEGYQSAIRVSEFEEFNYNPELLPPWLWLDSFSGDWSYLPLLLEKTKDFNIRTCLVSPELQGRDSASERMNLAEIIGKLEIDAICSKNRKYWKNE